MKIRINGDHRDFSDPLTLAELVASLGMKADRVAVELNREIVQRTKWAETSLREGDKLEIVHFVGGGSGLEVSLMFAPIYFHLVTPLSGN